MGTKAKPLRLRTQKAYRESPGLRGLKTMVRYHQRATGRNRRTWGSMDNPTPLTTTSTPATTPTRGNDTRTHTSHTTPTRTNTTTLGRPSLPLDQEGWAPSSRSRSTDLDIVHRSPPQATLARAPFTRTRTSATSARSKHTGTGRHRPRRRPRPRAGRRCRAVRRRLNRGAIGRTRFRVRKRRRRRRLWWRWRRSRI